MEIYTKHFQETLRNPEYTQASREDLLAVWTALRNESNELRVNSVSANRDAIVIADAKRHAIEVLRRQKHVSYEAKVTTFLVDLMANCSLPEDALEKIRVFVTPNGVKQ